MHEDPDNKVDLRGCRNGRCDLRHACGRWSDEGIYLSGGQRITFNHGRKDGEHCRAFVVREALGGAGNTDIVFRGSDNSSRRRGGRIHNPHAGVRTSYPGTEALFGKIFGRGRRGPYKLKYADPLPKGPDLMVSRHIAKGRDINNPEE